jgi:glutathionylspermidine synthase
MDFIDRYLPFTSLQADSFEDGDTCVKPYFGREGENVDFAYRISGGEEDVIFQQRIEIGRAPFDVVGHKHIAESAYPVIGAFTLGTGQFGGIYTRVGARITDKRAVYVPTYVKR